MPITDTDTREAEQEQLPEVSFAEFAATTYEKWKDEAITSLKGGIFEKKLITKTYEDIDLEPIYTRDHADKLDQARSYPGFGNFLRGTKASGYITKPWVIAQRCDEAQPDKSNRLLRHELEKGSTGIHIVLDTPTQRGLDAGAAAPEEVGDQGVSVSTLQDMNELLLGVDVPQYDFHCYTGASPVMIIGLLGALAKTHGWSATSIHGCAGADPLGALAANGTLPCQLDDLYDELAHTVAWTAENMPHLRSILVRGETYHDGGASAVQEIAYAMSTAIEYIRVLQFRGLPVDTIAASIRFSFSLGANYFMEIAKIRAARMVWAQIAGAFGGSEEAQKISIHARTSLFTKTVYDPYVNMLRTTTEAFSGVVGGVDSMEVTCFDEAVRPGDEFSRRIARNTQIMLQNECNLLQPVDPAGGSWYIETLTNQIAEKVWKLVQQLEELGGMSAALKQGHVQQSIQDVLKKRFRNLAVRADRAVGTNMYANGIEKPLPVPKKTPKATQAFRKQAVQDYRADIDETYCHTLLAVLPDAANAEAGQLLVAVIKAFQAGATIGEVRSVLIDFPGESIEPVSVHRWTEQFEELRGRTEAFKQATGKNVRIFLANMGNIPQHKARADFTIGFMEVAGFELITNDGFPEVEQAVQAAISADADVAVICSTDDTYPELVPPLARQIKEERPAMKVIVAGAPAKEYESLYREAGVDDFIHVRANCYEVLSGLQKAKGMV